MVRLFRLTFTAGVHIGDVVIDKTMNTICADTIFSALCCEALKTGGAELIETLVSHARRGALTFSDALPFAGNAYFIPMPVTCRASAGSYERNKALKKLPFISADTAGKFLTGNIKENTITDNKQHLSSLGKADITAKVQIPAGSAGVPPASSSAEEGVNNPAQTSDTEPYHVGVYTFGAGAGLYIIADADEPALDLFRELITAVSYAGIGGRRSSGYGRFTVTEEFAPDFITDGLSGDFPVYIALSVCLPADEEADGILKDAAYTLIRRGGFVFSDTYADTPVRKNDLYVMAAGAVVKNRFKGDVYDVSNDGAHAVYRYAKPLLLGVSI